MPSLCQNIKLAYERLQELQTNLLREYDQAKDNGDLTLTKRLLAEFEVAYNELDTNLYLGWTLEGNLNKQERDVLIAEYETESWMLSVTFGSDGSSLAVGSDDRKARVLGEKD